MITSDEITISSSSKESHYLKDDSSLFSDDENEFAIRTMANDIMNFAREHEYTTTQAVKIIADSSSVAKRTLDRFIDIAQNKGDIKVFKPHVGTFKKFYGFYYQTNSFVELLTKTPENITNFILKYSNQTGLSVGSSDMIKNTPIVSSLTNNSLFNMVYLMTTGDHGTDIESVRAMYGIQGLKILDELKLHGLVKVLDDDRIVRDKTIVYDNDIRVNFSKTVINDLYNLNKNEIGNTNYIAFINGEVTSHDYLEIKRIEKNTKDLILKKVQASRPTREEAIKIAISGTVIEIPSMKGEA